MSVLSRRKFVGASAAAVLSTARSYSQIVGANERLRVGVIGCGGQAMGHMHALHRNRDIDNVAVTAVCDIYQKRLDEAVKFTKGKPYKNYHDLLASSDVDYVLISTPEHWHAPMIIDTIAANKHVYCEKPMTRTVEEAKRVVARMRTAKGKMQVGVQGMSDESYEEASKYVKDGVLGRVVLAQIDYSRNHKGDFMQRPVEQDAQPGVNVDWKAFLGPAPKRSWDADRFFSWRRYWDYSAGISSDLFIHRVSRIIKAMNLTFPERGVGAGGKFEFRNSTAEVPDTMNILLDYPEGLTVQLISSMANDTRVDHMLRGHKATLTFTPTGFTITPQRMYQGEVKEVVYKKKGAEDLSLHHRNLMNAIRRNELLKCDVMLGYYGVVASEMGVQSYRQSKYMRWDKAKERIVKA
jgi:predicted dehydrogenase